MLIGILEDSIFLNLVRGEREHENYGVTHTIFYELVDEKLREAILGCYKSECRSCGNDHLKQIVKQSSGNKKDFVKI